MYFAITNRVIHVKNMGEKKSLGISVCERGCIAEKQCENFAPVEKCEGKIKLKDSRHRPPLSARTEL